MQVDPHIASTATSAAKAAGAILKELFYAGVEIRYKDAHNPVTEADQKSEDIILGALRQAFPDHTIYSEEAGLDDKQHGYAWVVDPLDGTSNFSRGIPHFCVSIGLVRDGQPILGVIYQPISDELFVGIEGEGATLNSKPITVSSAVPEKTMGIATRGATPEQKQRHKAIVGELITTIRTLRVLGSAATDLAYTAAGRLDVFVANGINFHDIVAGAVIAKEAGASLTSFDGAPWQGVIGQTSDLLVVHPDSVSQYEFLHTH